MYRAEAKSFQELALQVFKEIEDFTRELVYYVNDSGLLQTRLE